MEQVEASAPQPLEGIIFYLLPGSFKKLLPNFENRAILEQIQVFPCFWESVVGRD